MRFVITEPVYKISSNHFPFQGRKNMLKEMIPTADDSTLTGKQTLITGAQTYLLN